VRSDTKSRSLAATTAAARMLVMPACISGASDRAASLLTTIIAAVLRGGPASRKSRRPTGFSTASSPASSPRPAPPCKGSSTCTAQIEPEPSRPIRRTMYPPQGRSTTARNRFPICRLVRSPITRRKPASICAFAFSNHLAVANARLIRGRFAFLAAGSSPLSGGFVCQAAPFRLAIR
jgi:hypothetical protein